MRQQEMCGGSLLRRVLEALGKHGVYQIRHTGIFGRTPFKQATMPMQHRTSVLLLVFAHSDRPELHVFVSEVSLDQTPGICGLEPGFRTRFIADADYSWQRARQRCGHQR